MTAKARSFVCFSIAMLTTALPSRGGETESASVPPASEILAKLRHEHPRLLASTTDFARLKEGIATDARLKEWHQKLRDRAERILTEPPSR
jgi:hypothetical protein